MLPTTLQNLKDQAEREIEMQQSKDANAARELAEAQRASAVATWQAFLVDATTLLGADVLAYFDTIMPSNFNDRSSEVNLQMNLPNYAPVNINFERSIIWHKGLGEYVWQPWHTRIDNGKVWYVEQFKKEWTWDDDVNICRVRRNRDTSPDWFADLGHALVCAEERGKEISQLEIEADQETEQWKAKQAESRRNVQEQQAAPAPMTIEHN